MKTTVKSNSVFKTIALTTAAVLLAGSPLSSFANSGKEKHRKLTSGILESEIDVQYTGSENNRFNFVVKFENTSGQTFTVVVKDDEGEIIYSKDFSGEHFSKTFQLVKNEDDTNSIHPTFAVSEGDGTVQRRFSIAK